MSEVKIKSSACLDCCTSVFTVYDKTGPYHATLNPYGWAIEGSGSNIEISDVESSGLTVTTPSGTVYGPYSLLDLTRTTASFVVPAVGSTVTIALSGTSPYYTAWMQVGMNIKIGAAGIYTVVSFTATAAVVRNIGTPNTYYAANAVATTVIATNQTVGIAVLPSATGASFIIDPTDILGSGEGEVLEDGYYTFDWTVQGVWGPDDTPFHARCVNQEIALCAVECCVDNLAPSTIGACGCKTSTKYNTAVLTLEAIRSKDRKRDRAGALAHLSNLQDICNNNCKNC